jgi:hypothetical protein
MSTRSAQDQLAKAATKKARTAQEEKRRQSNLKSQRNWRLRKEKYLKDLEETVVELESQHDTLINESKTLKSIISNLLKSPQMPVEVAAVVQKKLTKEKISLASNVTQTMPRMTEAVLQNHGGSFTSNRSGTPSIPRKSATPESGYGSTQSVESPEQVLVPSVPQFNFGITQNTSPIQTLDQLFASLSAAKSDNVMTWSPVPVAHMDSFTSNGSFADTISDLKPSTSPPTLAQLFDPNSLALLSALLPQTTEDTGFWKDVDQVSHVTLPAQPASPVVGLDHSPSTLSNGEPHDTAETLDDLGQWTNFDLDEEMPSEETDLPTLNTQQLGTLRAGKEYEQSVKQLRPLLVRLPAGMIHLLYEIDLDRVPCSLLKGKLRLMRIRFNDAWHIIQQQEATGNLNKDEIFKQVFDGEHAEELCDLFQAGKSTEGSKELCNPETMQEVTESVISALSTVKILQENNLDTTEIGKIAMDQLEAAIDKCPNSHTTFA